MRARIPSRRLRHARACRHAQHACEHGPSADQQATHRQRAGTEQATNRQRTDNEQATNRQPTGNQQTTNKQPSQQSTSSQRTANQQPTASNPPATRQPTKKPSTSNKLSGHPLQFLAQAVASSRAGPVAHFASRDVRHLPIAFKPIHGWQRLHWAPWSLDGHRDAGA